MTKSARALRAEALLAAVVNRLSADLSRRFGRVETHSVFSFGSASSPELAVAFKLLDVNMFVSLNICRRKSSFMVADHSQEIVDMVDVGGCQFGNFSVSVGRTLNEATACVLSLHRDRRVNPR